MRGLSLWQPWASLIAIGVKTFETRTWPPPRTVLGQRIAIHAAKRPPVDDCDDLYDALGCGPADLPLGALVCTGVVTGGYQTGDTVNDRGRLVVGIARLAPGSRSINSYVPVDAYGDFSMCRWLWRIEDVVPLDPTVPFKAHQGVFLVPDEALVNG